MDIQSQIETAKVIYAKDLVKSIFPDDSWMTKSRNDTQYVNGKQVERSNVAGKPQIRRNKQSLKIDAKRRTLVADNYPISEFSSDPEALVFTEESLSNPEMRANALDEHQKGINEQVGHFLKSQWAASDAAAIIRTSGANRAATGKAATGTRKTVTYSDFLEAYQRFLLWDIMPDSLLIPATMYTDMLKIQEFIQNDYVNDKVVPTGKIGRILGMEVFATSMGVHYDNTATPIVQELVPEDDGSDEGVTFAGGAASNLGILMWNKDFVTRAKGNAKVFITLDDAEAQSTIMSANCIAGGAKYRKDRKGVISIVEAVGA
jgi:hypothetical protein